MSKFRALNEAQNCRLNQAISLLSIRQQLRLPALGVVCIGNDGSIVDQPDFEANGINDAEPLCFHVRTHPAIAATEEQSVPFPGQFVNAAMELDTIRRAPDMTAALSRLIAMQRPGISMADVEGALNSLPGVAAARTAAIKKWFKSAAEAPPPFPPGP